MRDNDPTEGIRKLMKELLEVSLQGLKTKNQARRKKLLAWFQDEDEQYVFSFVPLCDYLGLNPIKIRVELPRYMEQKKRKPGAKGRGRPRKKPFPI